MDTDLLYKIGLHFLPDIGNITAKKLIAYTGSVEAIFKEKKANLMKIPGIGSYLADNIITNDALQKAEEELKIIEDAGIQTFFYLDKNYPERLKQCTDAPILFFYKGDICFNQTKIISIVGTRNATNEGKDFCKKFVADLVEKNHCPVIVSGLAYGIDIAAHKAALQNKLKTIAVLAQGLETKIYPSLHTKIAEDIVENGGILSEFHSGCVPIRENFLKRNRIIAGISDATIVVESAVKGGALVTADIAFSYSRDVFAVPGRITDKYSQGCNALIKSNKAALIENADDLENYLGWQNAKKVNAPVQMQLFHDLSEEENIIVELLKENEQMSIDMISLKSELAMSKISGLLLNLEFAGIVRCLPGKNFKLNKA